MKSEQIYVDRLTRVAEILENISDLKSFNLGTWRSSYSVASCGFTACAVGWACQDKELQAQGLSMEEVTGDFTPYWEIRNKELTDWSAVTAFFGLSMREVNTLFVDEAYENYDDTTPEEVAQRIRKFLNTGILESYSHDV